MSIPTNYATLKTAIEGELARSDLTADLPTFIDRGEKIINRHLRTLAMETTLTTMSLAAAASSMDLPAGYLEIITLRYNEDGYQPAQVALEKLDEEGITGTSRPYQFSISDKIYFPNAADTTYAMTMRYFKEWDIAADTTNSLLTSDSDVYVLAGLVGSLTKTGTHARADEWKGELQLMMDGLNGVARRSKRNVKVTVDPGLRRSTRFNVTRGW